MAELAIEHELASEPIEAVESPEQLQEAQAEEEKLPDQAKEEPAAHEEQAPPVKHKFESRFSNGVLQEAKKPTPQPRPNPASIRSLQKKVRDLERSAQKNSRILTNMEARVKSNNDIIATLRGNLAQARQRNTDQENGSGADTTPATQSKYSRQQRSEPKASMEDMSLEEQMQLALQLSAMEYEASCKKQIEEIESGDGGLTRDEMLMVERVKVEEDRFCLICSDVLAQGDVAKSIPGCGHIFHVRCAEEWMAKKRTCPDCGKNILD